MSGSVDDSGTEDGGKYQGWVSLSFDNPFTINDILSLTWRQGLQNSSDKKSTGIVLHYSFPWRNWNFAMNYSQGDYEQNIKGAFINYDYSGVRNSIDISAKKLLYRNATRKIYADFKIDHKESYNYIDDVEVEVQRRKTSGWTLTFSDKEYLGKNTLDSQIIIYQGTSWLGAIAAPEEMFNEGTARPNILRYQINGEIPLKKSFRYGFQIYGQQTSDALIPQDRFAIGGRWSVRGFDGEQSLSAEKGVYLRNELGWKYLPTHQIYLGLDYGQVSGPSTLYLVGTSLAGAVLGIKGGWQYWNYEIFTGKPISKPSGFKTESAFGVSISYQY